MHDYRYADHNDEEAVERAAGIIEAVPDQVYNTLRYRLSFDYEFVNENI